ncbi:MAG: TetR/AcrR family transcriptional regulator [Actinomycetota bacterium]
MGQSERTFTRKGASTRNRIVEAARSMLLEKGYEGLVLRELADSLGITLGNLQYYFGTREALALHVLGIEGRRDTELIEARRRVDTPADTFRFVVRDMAARYRGESGRLLLLIIVLAEHRPSFEALCQDSYREFFAAFEGLLAEMKPGLPPGEVAARARIINALVEGSTFQVDVGDLDAFLDRVQAEAELIALG